MSITKRKVQIDPDATYIAWQSFAGEYPDGTPVAVAAEERLRGDHPAVQKYPHLFVLDGTPRSEWPGVFDGIVAAADARASAIVPPAPPRIDPSTPLAELYVAVADILQSQAGACRIGRIVLRDDPLVLGAPSAFAPLIERLD